MGARGHVLVAALAFAGCSSFGSDNPAQPVDGGIDAGPAAPTNLLTNGDFEIGCGGWAVTPPTIALQKDAEHHGGTASCRVCRAGFTGFVEMYADLKGDIPEGTYVFEAWVRTASATSPSFETRVDVYDGSGGISAGGQYSPGPLVTSDWSQSSQIVDVKAVGKGLRVYLSVNNGDCWLVDDVILYRK